MKIHILHSTLISKEIELFQQLNFFGLRSIGNKKDLLYSKSTCTSDNITHIISFANVMEQQVPLWLLLLHSFYKVIIKSFIYLF